jgi:hypothetical protein
MVRIFDHQFRFPEFPDKSFALARLRAVLMVGPRCELDHCFGCVASGIADAFCTGVGSLTVPICSKLNILARVPPHMCYRTDFV